MSGLRKVIGRLLVAIAMAFLLLLVAYGCFYAFGIRTEVVPAGTEVYLSCGLGAPLQASTSRLRGTGRCRVFKSYRGMVIFRVAFQVESLCRTNMLMRVEEP